MTKPIFENQSKKKIYYILFRMAIQIEQIKSYWKWTCRIQIHYQTNVIRKCSPQFAQICKSIGSTFEHFQWNILLSTTHKKTTPASIYTAFVLLLLFCLIFFRKVSTPLAHVCVCVFSVCQYELQFEKDSLFFPSEFSVQCSSALIQFHSHLSIFRLSMGNSSALAECTYSIHSYRFGKQRYIPYVVCICIVRANKKQNDWKHHRLVFDVCVCVCAWGRVKHFRQMHPNCFEHHTIEIVFALIIIVSEWHAYFSIYAQFASNLSIFFFEQINYIYFLLTAIHNRKSIGRFWYFFPLTSALCANILIRSLIYFWYSQTCPKRDLRNAWNNI